MTTVHRNKGDYKEENTHFICLKQPNETQKTHKRKIPPIFLVSIFMLIILFPQGNDRSSVITPLSNSGSEKRCLGSAVIQTKEGGFAFAGSTNYFGAGKLDYWFVKTNVNGELEWSYIYGGEKNDIALSLIQTTDGGYAMTGLTDSYGEGGSDFWLIKTDSDGKLEWDHTYGGDWDEYAHKIVQTMDSGYCMAGIGELEAFQQDFWLVKTDANGIEEWNHTYNWDTQIREGDDWDEARDMMNTNDGGFALTGVARSDEEGRNVWLVKTDMNGEREWDRTYGGPENDEADCIIQSIDGGYAIAGATGSFGGGDYDCDLLLIKTDTDGNMEWNRTYGGIGEDSASTIIQTEDRNYFILGTTQSFGIGESDIWLIKIDEKGDVLWNQTYGGPNGDGGAAMVPTVDGGFIIVGSTSSYPDYSTKAWLIKIDENGVVEWNQTYYEIPPNNLTSTQSKIISGKTPIMITLALAVLLLRKRMKSN